MRNFGSLVSFWKNHRLCMYTYSRRNSDRYHITRHAHRFLRRAFVATLEGLMKVAFEASNTPFTAIVIGVPNHRSRSGGCAHVTIWNATDRGSVTTEELTVPLLAGSPNTHVRLSNFPSRTAALTEWLTFNPRNV